MDIMPSCWLTVNRAPLVILIGLRQRRIQSPRIIIIQGVSGKMMCHSFPFPAEVAQVAHEDVHQSQRYVFGVVCFAWVCFI